MLVVEERVVVVEVICVGCCLQGLQNFTSNQISKKISNLF